MRVRKPTVTAAITAPEGDSGGRHQRASALWQCAQLHLAKGTEYRQSALLVGVLAAQALEACGVLYIEIEHNSLVSSASGEQVCRNQSSGTKPHG